MPRGLDWQKAADSRKKRAHGIREVDDHSPYPVDFVEQGDSKEPGLVPRNREFNEKTARRDLRKRAADLFLREIFDQIERGANHYISFGDTGALEKAINQIPVCLMRGIIIKKIESNFGISANTQKSSSRIGLRKNKSVDRSEVEAEAFLHWLRTVLDL